MHQAFKALNRITLILGVLVALTPCGLCHAAMEKASPACSMKSMAGKMDCCHKDKQASPLCKVMNQSSTAAVSHGLEAVPAPVVVFASPLGLSFTGSLVSSIVQVDTSPLRAPLSLRI